MKPISTTKHIVRDTTEIGFGNSLFFKLLKKTNIKKQSHTNQTHINEVREKRKAAKYYGDDI